MQHSETIATLASSLVKAQALFSPAIKAKTNGAFKGATYADLASVIDAAQPALLDNGIAVLQGVSGDVATNSITVSTRLLHTSGEWMESSLTLPATNRGNYDAQSVGSAITYGRRYAYMAMLGLAPEDDDGNAASGKETPRQTVQPKSQFKEQLRASVNQEAEPVDDGAPPYDDSFLDDPQPRPQDKPKPSVDTFIGPKSTVLYAIAMKKGWTKEQYWDFIKRLGYAKDKDIPSSRFNEIKDRLEAA